LDWGIGSVNIILSITWVPREYSSLFLEAGSLTFARPCWTYNFVSQDKSEATFLSVLVDGNDLNLSLGLGLHICEIVCQRLVKRCLQYCQKSKKMGSSLIHMCHPYAGAMLIFSVFFRFRHMPLRRGRNNLEKCSIYTHTSPD